MAWKNIACFELKSLFLKKRWIQWQALGIFIFILIKTDFLQSIFLLLSNFHDPKANALGEMKLKNQK